METKILVLRTPHKVHQDEFILSKDLPNLLSYVTYDEELAIYLSRTN